MGSELYPKILYIFAPVGKIIFNLYNPSLPDTFLVFNIFSNCNSLENWDK